MPTACSSSLRTSVRRPPPRSSASSANCGPAGSDAEPLAEPRASAPAGAKASLSARSACPSRRGAEAAKLGRMVGSRSGPWSRRGRGAVDPREGCQARSWPSWLAEAIAGASPISATPPVEPGASLAWLAHALDDVELQQTSPRAGDGSARPPAGISKPIRHQKLGAGLILREQEGCDAPDLQSSRQCRVVRSLDDMLHVRPPAFPVAPDAGACLGDLGRRRPGKWTKSANKLGFGTLLRSAMESALFHRHRTEECQTQSCWYSSAVGVALFGGSRHVQPPSMPSFAATMPNNTFTRNRVRREWPWARAAASISRLATGTGRLPASAPPSARPFHGASPRLEVCVGRHSSVGEHRLPVGLSCRLTRPAAR